MELATNLFTHGLQSDTHPMVLSNDTLTDCLNGTLITMNGNEIILLNDMGNRRVDNAFLPSGYQPVGMKEYGGVIYVAAYNPITNKSQIGSFPSPQRKINATLDRAKEFDFNSFINNAYIDSELGEKVLKSDSYMIPLTDDVALRAGDKFTIYANGLSEMKDDITNYDNYSLPSIGSLIYAELDSRVKAKSPKNRKYTIQVGILNSQNEFVDITKTLCRWVNVGLDKWKIAKFGDNTSDVYKFNYGYFIPDDFPNVTLSETIDDAELIRNRQVIEANTYAYKLVGPLYLKISLNHIENFNYNIYGIKNDTNDDTYTLWIEGFITYNCPDGVFSLSGGNEYYETFNEGTPNGNFEPFRLIEKDNNNKDVPSLEDTYGETTYNPDTNLYSLKVVRCYDKIKRTDDYIYKYKIGVIADYVDKEKNIPIYLKGLSAIGELDLSLLGSGKLSVEGWRFYNDVNKRITTLTYSLNAYPKYGNKFTNLRFIFYEYDSNTGFSENKKICYPSENKGFDSVYNGRVTIDIPWDIEYDGNTYLLNPRKVYLVQLKYDVVDNDNNPVGNSEEERHPVISDGLWILTTELFNEFYFLDMGISNFCTTKDLRFLDKMILHLENDFEIINSSETTEELHDENFVSIAKQLVKYTCKSLHHFKLKVRNKIRIVNEELYPDFLKICNSTSIQFNNFLSDINSSNFKENVLLIYGLESDSQLITEYNKLPLIEKEEIIKKTDDGDQYEITIDVTNTDVYLGISDKQITELHNVFGYFSDTIKEIFNTEPEYNKQYSGIILNYSKDTRDINQSWHTLDIPYKLTEDHIDDIPGENDTFGTFINISAYRTQIKHEDTGVGDSLFLFKFNNNQGNIYEMFDKSIYPGCMFMYMFANTGENGYGTNSDLLLYNGNYLAKNENIVKTSSKYPLNRDELTKYNKNINYGGAYTRIWWKCNKGGWALFNIPLKKSKDSNINKTDNKLGFSHNISYEDILAYFFGEFKNEEYKKGLFPKDFVYCMYDDYTLNSNEELYTIGEKYIYTDKYDIPITYSFDFDFVTNSRGYIENINKQYSNLVFDVSKKLENSKNNNFTINLKSSDKFKERIETFDFDNISNIFYSTDGGCYIVDNDGDTLDKNKIYFRISHGSFFKSGLIDNKKTIPIPIVDPYYNKSDGIYKYPNDCLFIDNTNKTLKGRNILLYNRELPSGLLFRFDFIPSDADSGKYFTRTALDYNGVNVVSKDIVTDSTERYV